MRPGPPKQPTALRLIKGNVSHRPVNKDEPKPDIGVPQPPAWLCDYALEEWNYITPKLAKYRVVSDLDRAVLVCYCEAFADYRRAREQLSDQALVIERRFASGSRREQPNPYLSIANKAQRILHSCLSELGLTPAARARVTTDPRPDSDDPFGVLGDRP